jgi:raffinose/stachyose/melibiose transport system permease protein
VSESTVVRGSEGLGLGARKRLLAAFEIFMIVLALAFIYPVIYVLINAFKSTQDIVLDPVGLPAHPTFENFAKVLKTEGAGGVSFIKSLFNTLALTVASVSLIIVFSSACAYKLVRTKSWVSTAIFFAFAFFMVIPFQTIMVPLVVLATDLRFKDVYGLILINVGLGAPTAVFMYHGFIKAVPLSLEEAAAIDGAGPYRMFFQIVFPLLVPITATIGILDVLWVWNDFLLPYIILRQGTLVLFQYNFFGTFTKDYGALTASLVMTATPVVIMYIAMQKYIIKGISAGAVKG